MLPQSLWCFCNHFGVFAIILVLSQSLWCFRNHFGASAITLVLPQSLWCFCNHFIVSAITLVLSQSLWCLCNHFDASANTLVLQQSLWCFRNHFGASAITLMLQQSLWCFRNHFGVSAITLVLSQSLWCLCNHFGASAITLVLLQSLWCFRNHFGTFAITMVPLQSLWYLCKLRRLCTSYMPLLVTPLLNDLLWNHISPDKNPVRRPRRRSRDKFGNRARIISAPTIASCVQRTGTAFSGVDWQQRSAFPYPYVSEGFSPRPDFLQPPSAVAVVAAADNPVQGELNAGGQERRRVRHRRVTDSLCTLRCGNVVRPLPGRTSTAVLTKMRQGTGRQKEDLWRTDFRVWLYFLPIRPLARLQ